MGAILSLLQKYEQDETVDINMACHGTDLVMQHRSWTDLQRGDFLDHGNEVVKVVLCYPTSLEREVPGLMECIFD